MNEQLESAVVKILERAISGIDSGVEFMQSELPDVIDQLLTWYLAKGVITAIIGLLFIIQLVILVKIYLKKDIKGAKSDSFWVDHYDHIDNSMGMGAFLAFVFSGMLSIIGLIMFFSSIFEVVKIWVAPKIWLMEYAALLVK